MEHLVPHSTSLPLEPIFNDNSFSYVMILYVKFIKLPIFFMYIYIYIYIYSLIHLILFSSSHFSSNKEK